MKSFIIIFASMLLSIATSHAASVDEWLIKEAQGRLTTVGNQSVGVGDIIKTGDWIWAGADSSALLVNNERKIWLAPNSRIVISVPDKPRHTLIMQLAGKAKYEVDRRKSPHFEVRSGLIAAVVKGTVFVVDTETSAHSVTVSEGLVDVALLSTGNHVQVPAGQSAAAKNGRLEVQASLSIENQPSQAADSAPDEGAAEETDAPAEVKDETTEVTRLKEATLATPAAQLIERSADAQESAKQGSNGNQTPLVINGQNQGVNTPPAAVLGNQIIGGASAPTEEPVVSGESGSEETGGPNTIDGAPNAVAGFDNFVKGKVNNLIGNQNFVDGDANSITGNNNNIKNNLNTAIGDRNTIDGEENQITGDDNYVKKNANFIIGYGNSIEGDLNYVDGDDNELIDDKNTVLGDKNMIDGKMNDIEGSFNVIDGASNYARGVWNNIIGNDNSIEGDWNSIVGDDNTIVGLYNEIVGNDNSITGDSNFIDGDKNIIQGDGNTIAGDENNLDGDLNAIVGEENFITGSSNTIYADEVVLNNSNVTIQDD